MSAKLNYYKARLQLDHKNMYQVELIAHDSDEAIELLEEEFNFDLNDMLKERNCEFLSLSKEPFKYGILGYPKVISIKTNKKPIDFKFRVPMHQPCLG